jgi:hypothetical protein
MAADITLKYPARMVVDLAERVGFEPTVELPRQQFSRLNDAKSEDNQTLHETPKRSGADGEEP